MVIFCPIERSEMAVERLKNKFTSACRVSTNTQIISTFLMGSFPAMRRYKASPSGLRRMPTFYALPDEKIPSIKNGDYSIIGTYYFFAIYSRHPFACGD